MNKKYIADFTLLFVAFVWGTTFVVVQNAISFLQPHTFNAVRFFMAALLLSVWLVVFRRDEIKAINKKLLLSGMAIGFWLFIGYACQTIGLVYTTSSKAGFITGLSVVLVPLLSFFILKIKPGIYAIIGVCIATVGLYLKSGRKNDSRKSRLARFNPRLKNFDRGLFFIIIAFVL